MKAVDKKLDQVRLATRSLRLSESKKDEALKHLANSLIENNQKILSANAKDLKALGKMASSAFVDRLTLNPKRIEQMAESLRAVAALKDPVGEIVDTVSRPNGLVLKKVRAPLGVIFMIFESRPNVAIEAFSLGFKAGNGMVLRGGKESKHTVGLFYKLIGDSLKQAGLDPHLLWGITDYDRAITKYLLKQKNKIDVVVPRGGDGLIETVVRESLIPIIKNDRGLCHIYVHKDADLNMAVDILINAKTQRPGVCNAAETLLVHKSVAQEFLPRAYETLQSLGVQWFGCPKTCKILKNEKNVKKASAKSFATEYLDLKLNCKVVDDIDSALQHIETFGSRHSEAIVTQSEKTATEFQNQVDAAAVYWNASTRFTDGFEFGLGGELGISTQKLHARGPVGLKELTCLRWLGFGQGQIRI